MPATPPEPDLDELGLARAMAAGDLPSPQHYENVWLFALRITGTGMAYRSAHNEFVWRDRDLYLNDEFLARCNGLPVVWEHPDKSILDTKEYADRAIGAIMLPYIQGEDVWGIAKIHDAVAAEAMTDKQLSTSPGVVFRDPTVNSKRLLEDGATLLIEGKPSLLDHLAVCELGVWDKSGPPVGVLNETLTTVDERADSMTDDEKAAAADKARKDAEDKAKADADAGQKLDKILTHMDSMSARMDAMEMADKARKDAEEKEKAEKADAARKDKMKADAEEHEGWKKADAAMCAKDDAEEETEAKELEEKGETKEVAADKARKSRKDRMDARRKDSEESAKKEEEEKAKADAARVDSVSIAELKREIAMLKARTEPVPDDQRAAFADFQARGDGAYMSLGQRAPAPMSGENLLAYRTRLARGLQKHSPDWKGIELHRLQPEVLAVAEAKIYADADIAARAPDDVEFGTLREITKIDPSTGQRMTTFVGKGTFIGALKRPSRRVIGINTKAGA